MCYNKYNNYIIVRREEVEMMNTKDNKYLKFNNLSNTPFHEHRVNADGTAVVMYLIIIFLLVLFFVSPPVEAEAMQEFEAFKLVALGLVMGGMVTNIYNIRYYKTRKMLLVLSSIAGLSGVIIALGIATRYVSNDMYSYIMGAVAVLCLGGIIVMLKSMKTMFPDHFTAKKDIKYSPKCMYMYAVIIVFGVSTYFASSNYIATLCILILGISVTMAGFAMLLRVDGLAFYNKPSWYILFAFILSLSMILLHTLEQTTIPIMFNFTLITAISMPYCDICIGNYNPNWQATDPIMMKLNNIIIEDQARLNDRNVMFDNSVDDRNVISDNTVDNSDMIFGTDEDEYVTSGNDDETLLDDNITDKADGQSENIADNDKNVENNDEKQKDVFNDY